MRDIRGEWVADKNGMPTLVVNHDDLVKACWEMVMEKYSPKPPKPIPFWRRWPVRAHGQLRASRPRASQ